MPPLIQVCIVIATLALVAGVLATVRTMIQLTDTAGRISRLTDAAQLAIAQVDRAGREAQDLVASLRGITTPIQQIAQRFGSLGVRAADLSTAVFDEVEMPLLTAVAVSRGVKAGASHLIDRLIHRFSRPHSSSNGDTEHEFDSIGRP